MTDFNVRSRFLLLDVDTVSELAAQNRILISNFYQRYFRNIGMASTTLETIDELLEGALSGVDNDEARYKIRSAQQLLRVVQQRDEDIDEVVENISDKDIIEGLKDLGYLN